MVARLRSIIRETDGRGLLMPPAPHAGRARKAMAEKMIRPYPASPMMAAKKKVKNSRKKKLMSNSRYPGYGPEQLEHGGDEVDPAPVAHQGRDVVAGGGILEQERPVVFPAGISQRLNLVPGQKTGQVGQRLGMAHGRRRFGQLDLAVGGLDGALQVAGRAAQPVQFQAQPAALGAVPGLQALQLGGAAPGRIQRLEFARRTRCPLSGPGRPKAASCRA